MDLDKHKFNKELRKSISQAPVIYFIFAVFPSLFLGSGVLKLCSVRTKILQKYRGRFGAFLF